MQGMPIRLWQTADFVNRLICYGFCFRIAFAENRRPLFGAMLYATARRSKPAWMTS
jgi:hypothetical protein